MNIAFDRGTVVLSGDLDGLDPLQLPGVVWDERVSRWRAPARCHARIVAELEARGVRISGQNVRPSGTSWIAPELRPYQSDAVEAWESAGRRGVIVLPTGSGKTRVAIAVATFPAWGTAITVGAAVVGAGLAIYSGYKIYKNWGRISERDKFAMVGGLVGGFASSYVKPAKLPGVGHYLDAAAARNAGGQKIIANLTDGERPRVSVYQ